MAKQEDVAKLSVPQLKELAERHNVEVASSDKKEDLVKKVSAGITPENLEAYNSGSEEQPANEVVAEDVEKSGIQGTDQEGTTVNEDAGADEPDAQSDGSNDEDQTVAPQADGIDGVERDHTPAATTEDANQTDAIERLQPPRAATGLDPKASDEAYEVNNQVSPVETAVEVKSRENEDNAEHVEARKDESREVETDLGSSEEEAAAARAGVRPERLENEKQNREPKNVFEESNQKVTEEERQAAQEVSDMTTEQRVEDSPTPAEAAQTDAARTAETNQNSDIAAAIAEGFKAAGANDKKFQLKADEGVEPRFTLVRNKDGDVMVRENETGHLSRLQLKSIEEQEASIQNQEVEEI